MVVGGGMRSEMRRDGGMVGGRFLYLIQSIHTCTQLRVCVMVVMEDEEEGESRRNI